jgi:hypothetical protein
MYFGDHSPPHFHAEYQGKQAEYSIKTLEIIAGNIPRRANSLILEWASLHREDLLKNWNKAQIPSELDKIEPLI